MKRTILDVSLEKQTKSIALMYRFVKIFDFVQRYLINNVSSLTLHQVRGKPDEELSSKLC